MKEEQKLGLNIQLFAEGDNDDGVKQPTPLEEKPVLTFDEILQNAKYQSAYDKKVALAIENSKIKWEADYKAKLEAEKTEAERVAKLSEAEKVKEEMAKKDTRIKELEEKVNARELKDETMKVLNDKNIPLNYIDLFDFKNSSAEEILEKVEILSSNLNKEKETWMNNSFKQKTPESKGNDNKETKPKTYEDFVKQEENK